MKRGKHQIRWQFNSTDFAGTPVKFSLNNGDYNRNFVVDSFEVIFCSMDKGTNNTSLSGKTHQVVLATTEDGATPHSNEDENARSYAMRVCDRRCIAWAQMDDSMQNTILDPHNIVADDLWLNAWAFGSAHDPTMLDQDIGVLITLSEVRQSGNEALLTQVRDSGID